jgi:hypothetical protein
MAASSPTTSVAKWLSGSESVTLNHAWGCHISTTCAAANNRVTASFLLEVEVQRHDTEVLHSRIHGIPAVWSWFLTGHKCKRQLVSTTNQDVGANVKIFLAILIQCLIAKRWNAYQLNWSNREKLIQRLVSTTHQNQLVSTMCVTAKQRRTMHLRLNTLLYLMLYNLNNEWICWGTLIPSRCTK